MGGVDGKEERQVVVVFGCRSGGGTGLRGERLLVTQLRPQMVIK